MNRSRALSKDDLLRLAGQGEEHRATMNSSPAPEPQGRAGGPAPATAAPDTPPAPPTPPSSAPRAAVAAPTPPAPRVQVPPRPEEPEPFLEDEPPAESFTSEQPRAGLPRLRRVGLRSDPKWTQKTVYLRRINIAAAETIADALGIEFSELIDYALTVQVMPETRSEGLADMLSRLRQEKPRF